MKALLRREYALFSVFALVGLLILLALSLPPERLLGSTIRIVLVHGALARAGLILFGIATLLGFAVLWAPESRVHAWLVASQKSAFAVWLSAALTSAVATYLSWGVVVAWGEPRTQGMIKILILGAFLMVLVRWIRNERFAGLANIVMGVFAWTTVLQSGSVQHPENPVGSSPSVFYQSVFVAMVVVTIVAAVQFARWVHRPSPAVA